MHNFVNQLLQKTDIRNWFIKKSMAKKIKKVIKILKIINSNWSEQELETKETKETTGPGRKQVYSELTLFKIFIIMILLNIPTIKGVWRLLKEEGKLKKYCGLITDIDRSTLSRRLSERIKNWF